MPRHQPPAPTNWQTVSAHVCALGESPFWHPQEQMLYWVDISGRQILRANVYMGSVQVWDMPSEPGCIAPAASGGLVIALRHGVFRARNWGGELLPLATLDDDPATLRANDGKCDTLGRFWVGTMDETRALRNAALYCIDARHTAPTGLARVQCKIGTVTPGAVARSPMTCTQAQSVTTANGLAFSPDNRTLYWADTPSHSVWAWDLDAPTSAITAQRVFASFAPKPDNWQLDPTDVDNGGYRGRPDGAAVDAQGNYWVAMFEGRRVCQFAPDGALLAEYPTPLQCPTMPCFGGEDLKTLYLTSARHHRSTAELAAFPLSGQVLSMRVEVAGLPVNFFQD